MWRIEPTDYSRHHASVHCRISGERRALSTCDDAHPPLGIPYTAGRAARTGEGARIADALGLGTERRTDVACRIQSCDGKIGIGTVVIFIASLQCVLWARDGAVGTSDFHLSGDPNLFRRKVG